MNSRTNRQPHRWVRFLLAYLVFAGFVPLLSELRAFGGVHANNPNHNFELAWGLMHILPSLIGIVMALWYLRYDSFIPAAAVVLLTLQALFALLEYRREGFDPRMSIDLSWSTYATVMLAVAAPFAAAYIIAERRRSLAQRLSV